jgi:hypothetical protein
MTWQGDKSVKIVAKKPLTERRSKYNCTMPTLVLKLSILA